MGRYLSLKEINMLNEKFEFLLVKIAAQGLDEKLLGKTLSRKEIDFLIGLERKTGFNSAILKHIAASTIIGIPFFLLEKSFEIQRIFERL